ncbi:MAG: NUDIX domain-containing protein [Desulfobacterales bacterium]|nr:NUDIX domain-containing protein [Desulfobacterales bacterium]
MKSIIIDKNKERRPFVGVATIVVKNSKILIGESCGKGSGFFYYGVPGGHLENNESLIQCAKREVSEEAGILIDNINLISVYDFYRKEKNRSYVTIGMKADWFSGIPHDHDDECSFRKNWQWYLPDEALHLSELFQPDRVLIERFLSGIIYEAI